MVSSVTACSNSTPGASAEPESLPSEPGVGASVGAGDANVSGAGASVSTIGVVGAFTGAAGAGVAASANSKSVEIAPEQIWVVHAIISAVDVRFEAEAKQGNYSS